MSYKIIQGDCLATMRTLDDNSVDAVVTDPPYGLSFMGKAWDYDVPQKEVWAEALRVAKPGAHLIAFFGSRTYHRGAVQIEDGGWEIRDMGEWCYGSGFPKSLNVGYELESHEGYGTALKPAHEPFVIARKPLGGTVAETCMKWGTGALNVDGGRVGDEVVSQHGRNGDSFGFTSEEPAGRTWVGRYPANLIHDGSEAVVALFPEQKSGSRNAGVRMGMGFHGANGDGGPAIEASEGSAARFFYCAKASKLDREEGLDIMPIRTLNRVNPGGLENDPRWAPIQRRNNHPTVKPTDLMRYLIKLVSPPSPSPLILDPFTGSGSTGKAAMLEGCRFIGCELDANFCEIARARCAWAKGLHNRGMTPTQARAAEKQRAAEIEGQGRLFEMGGRG